MMFRMIAASGAPLRLGEHIDVFYQLLLICLVDMVIFLCIVLAGFSVVLSWRLLFHSTRIASSGNSSSSSNNRESSIVSTVRWVLSTVQWNYVIMALLMSGFTKLTFILMLIWDYPIEFTLIYTLFMFSSDVVAGRVVMQQQLQRLLAGLNDGKGKGMVSAAEGGSIQSAGLHVKSLWRWALIRSAIIVLIGYVARGVYLFHILQFYQ